MFILARTGKVKAVRTPLEFYENGHGDPFADDSHLNREVAAFLKQEEHLMSAVADGIDTLIEVGCMHGRYLDWAVRHKKSYFGLDRVHRYIRAGRQEAAQRGLPYCDFQFMRAGAEQISELVSEKILRSRPERSLALFPFNSFGNMRDPVAIIKTLKESGLLFFISSYQFTHSATRSRLEYYSRCGYKNLRVLQYPEKIAIISAEGLRSYAYDPVYLLARCEEVGVSALALTYSDIGMAYVSQKLAPFVARYGAKDGQQPGLVPAWSNAATG